MAWYRIWGRTADRSSASAFQHTGRWERGFHLQGESQQIVAPTWKSSQQRCVIGAVLAAPANSFSKENCHVFMMEYRWADEKSLY